MVESNFPSYRPIRRRVYDGPRQTGCDQTIYHDRIHYCDESESIYDQTHRPERVARANAP